MTTTSHEHDADQPYDIALPWRVGRSLGRTLYVGPKHIGEVDTTDLALAIVDVMNGGTPTPSEGRRVGRMRAIGRTLYEAGADVGRVDTMPLATLIVSMMNTAYGHVSPAPAAVRRFDRDDAVQEVRANLQSLVRRIRDGRITPDKIGVNVDVATRQVIVLARLADAHAADVDLSPEGPTVAAAARSLAAGWSHRDGEPYGEYGGAAAVAAQALQAAATSMFAAGGTLYLSRLADEEEEIGADPALVALLRRAAAEVVGDAAPTPRRLKAGE